MTFMCKNCNVVIEWSNTTHCIGCESPLVQVTFDDYEAMVSELSVFKNKMAEELRTPYCAMGLGGEAGEAVDACKKVLRDNNGVFDKESQHKIMLELGDVLFYLTALASRMGYKLSDVAAYNEKKLRDRKARGVIHGSGDNR